MPSGPYTWVTATPIGFVDNINVGDAAIRQVKSALTDVFADWFHTWPNTAQNREGWPRVMVVTLRSSLNNLTLIAPYGRLAYAVDTNHLYRETESGWVNAHPVIAEVPVVTGLTGDGFLANPNLCGDQVFDYYGIAGAPRPTFRGIFVGRDWPCGSNATYRGFFRFDLTGKPTANIQQVLFAAFLIEKLNPSGNAELRHINDFGTLAFADYNIATITNLGQFVTPGTAIGWVTKDVTAAYHASLGAGVMCLQIRSNAEGADPGNQSRFYGFVSADDLDNTFLTPRILIGFAA